MDKLFSFMHVVVACRGEEGGNNMIPEGGRERQRRANQRKRDESYSSSASKEVKSGLVQDPIRF